MPRYYIDYNVSSGVNVGFTAIMIVPLSVIMCISFLRARRSNDPARVTTAYFKAMLPLAILYVRLQPKHHRDVVQRALLWCLVILGLFPLTLDTNRWLLFYTIQGALSIVYDNTYTETRDLYHATLRLSVLGTLFSNTTDLLLIMTLAELGNGFLFCLTQTRTALQNAVRYAAIASCTILSMFAIALFGVYNAIYSKYLSDRWYAYLDSSLRRAGRNMNIAFNIITFVYALLLLVFAAVVFHKTKRNCILKNVSCALSLLPRFQNHRQKANKHIIH